MRAFTLVSRDFETVASTLVLQCIVGDSFGVGSFARHVADQRTPHGTTANAAQREASDVNRDPTMNTDEMRI